MWRQAPSLARFSRGGLVLGDAGRPTACYDQQRHQQKPFGPLHGWQAKEFLFQTGRRLRNRSKRGASSEAGTETAFAIVRNAGLPRKPRLSVEVCLLRFFSLLLLAQGTPAFFPPGLRQGQGKMADAGGCAGLEPTGSMHLGALRQDVSLFRHAASGIRVALCPVPGPLCKADIVIPTECSDNGGLPHCLEHLVFMGSQRFPSRGYLDKLANLCISQVPDTPHSP